MVVAVAIALSVIVALGRHCFPSDLGCVADLDYPFPAHLEKIFRESITPALVQFVPYSGIAYICFVLGAVILRQWLVGQRQDAILIHPKVLMAHNLFLVLQSAILLGLGLDGFLFARTRESMSEATVLDVLISGEVYNYPYLNLALGTFLLSKAYEWVDTALLIVKNKPVGFLHLWHHGTIYVGFYNGFWTGAVSWFATMNSLVHVIMYMYYSGVGKRWIRPIARYVTVLQIMHLVGGASLALVTFVRPVEPFSFLDEDVADKLLLSGVYTSSSRSSAVIGTLIASYVLLFMAYYGRRYYEGGSLWMLLGGQALQTLVKEQVQDRTFGIFRHHQRKAAHMRDIARVVCWIEEYLILQGLLAPLGAESKNLKTCADSTISLKHAPPCAG